MPQALFIPECRSLPWRHQNKVVTPRGEWETLSDEPLDAECVRLFFADCPDDKDFQHRVRHVASGTTFDAASFARHFPAK